LHDYLHCVLVCVLVCSRLPVCPPAFSKGRTRCRRARALVELLLAAVTFTAAVALLFGIAHVQQADIWRQGGRQEGDTRNIKMYSSHQTSSIFVLPASILRDGVFCCKEYN
jgi:hypothetical protein